jgi:uncharacterized protein YjbJ (UPF0337 family)
MVRMGRGRQMQRALEARHPQKRRNKMAEREGLLGEITGTVQDTVQGTVGTVQDTVEGTLDTVEGTVEGTLDTVQDTLGDVKDTL